MVNNTESVEWMGRLHRSGGSLCVLLPKELHTQLGYRRGDYMAIVVIQPSPACPDTRLVMRRMVRSEVLDRDLEGSLESASRA